MPAHHTHEDRPGAAAPGPDAERQPAREKSAQEQTAVVLRPNSGVSGDILVAGLFRLSGALDEDLDEAVSNLGFPELKGKIRVRPKVLGAVAGWGLEIDLPREHEHRRLDDIASLFEKSKISPEAKITAVKAFRFLAEAEGKVHGMPPGEVEFHEVGALDSILDAGLAAVFFARLKPAVFVSGPLPVCDGTIKCAHGLLNSPAPAVAFLLEGAAVKGLESSGETITPTGISLLKAFGAVYGPWPEMTVESQTLVFGTRVLPGVPNGAQFARGRLAAPLY